MHIDFLRAISQGENLEIVEDRLLFLLKHRYDAAREQIRNDRRDAELILDGWSQPEDTIAHQYAAAVLQDADNLEKHKDEQTRRREATRQAAEEAWLADKKASGLRTTERRPIRDNAEN